MIYVTVGNAKYPFRRLLDAIPEFEGEAIIIQDRPFTRKEHQRLILEASVVVSHAGAGTILQCWEYKMVPVVVPRLKAYGEHVDSHQLELTKALTNYGMVIPVYDVMDLPEAIKKARTMKFPEMQQGDLAEHVAKALKEV